MLGISARLCDIDMRVKLNSISTDSEHARGQARVKLVVNIGRARWRGDGPGRRHKGRCLHPRK
jgi:hypothetical protein